MRRILKLFYMIVILNFGMMLTGCEVTEEPMFQEISEEELEEEGISGDTLEEKTETDDEEMIFVHVCGAVKNPGVYELKAGSRIYEALEAAGGVTKAAVEDSINQAEILSDGQQLYVTTKEELANQAVHSGTTADGKININSASKEELMTLSGIGEAKADAIIRYRDERGGFKSIEDIMEIEGIKEGVFRKIEKKITVS